MKRKTTVEFLIDGTPMLMPDAGVRIGYTDLEGESGRDESGFLHRHVIRSGMKKWDFSYALLTAEEYAYVRSLLRGKSTFAFTFTNESGEVETITAYCSETSAAYWSHRRGLYKEMQFSIIEC